MAALFTFGAPGLARAQGAPEPVDMSYRAPDGCPSLSQFLGEVQRSTQRLRLATAAETEAARHFDVVIEAKRGRLTVDGGSNGVREVTGADCAEVSRLLAFAAALAADPDAQEPDETSGVAAFPDPPSMPPLPAPTPMPSAALQRAPATTRAARPPTVLQTQWSIAAFGFAKSASAPGLTLGGGLFGALELSSVALAPSIRLGAGYDAKRVPSSPGSVTLSNDLLTLELCSNPLQRRSLELLPCVSAQGGARNATGHDLGVTRSRTRGFLDLGLAAHVRWRLADRLFAEAGAALLFPTVRDRVYVDTNSGVDTVYRIPDVGGLAEISLGVEFGDQNPD
jgi:hypothetical protein